MDHASECSAAPSGEQGAVRAFLIADIRGYTRFTAERGDEAAAALAARFTAVVRDAVGGRGGEVIELRGDEALAVFSSTRQALWAAAEMQGRFAAATRDDRALPLEAGIGLDAGEAVPVEGGYRGAALNRAARLCGLAGSGEVLASEGVLHLAGRIEGLTSMDRGSAQLKGFAEPVRVFGVRPEAGEQTVTPARESAGGTEPAAPEQHPPIGGFLGSLPAGPLVGRERELEQGLAAVEAVHRGEGRLLFLASDDAAHLTGNFLIDDGGCSMIGA